MSGGLGPRDRLWGGPHSLARSRMWTGGLAERLFGSGCMLFGRCEVENCENEHEVRTNLRLGRVRSKVLDVDAELPRWHEQLGHADLRTRERELREARGLSVHDLAEKAGLRSGDVANLENGRTFPVPESTLIALEGVLGEALPRPGPTGPLCDKEPLCWHRPNGESNRTLDVERADATVPVLGTTHVATRDGPIIASSGQAPSCIRLEPTPPLPAHHSQPAQPGVVMAVQGDTNLGSWASRTRRTPTSAW